VTNSPLVSNRRRRIGLLGAESTGKSTLAIELSRTIDAFIAEEYLRDFVRDFARLPTRGDQEGIFLTQQATVTTVVRAAEHAAVPWVIADPLPLMTAVYSIVYFDDDSLVDAGVADARDYDLLLWCASDFAGVDEPGMRDGEEVRQRTEAVIAEMIEPRLRASGCSVTRLTGDTPTRLTTLLPLLLPCS
jgi:nicotinamide riboside kinase